MPLTCSLSLMNIILAGYLKFDSTTIRNCYMYPYLVLLFDYPTVDECWKVWKWICPLDAITCFLCALGSLRIFSMLWIMNQGLLDFFRAEVRRIRLLRLDLCVAQSTN